MNTSVTVSTDEHDNAIQWSLELGHLRTTSETFFPIAKIPFQVLPRWANEEEEKSFLAMERDLDAAEKKFAADFDACQHLRGRLLKQPYFEDSDMLADWQQSLAMHEAWCRDQATLACRVEYSARYRSVEGSVRARLTVVNADTGEEIGGNMLIGSSENFFACPIAIDCRIAPGRRYEAAVSVLHRRNIWNDRLSFSEVDESVLRVTPTGP